MAVAILLHGDGDATLLFGVCVCVNVFVGKESVTAHPCGQATFARFHGVQNSRF
jgi:hypothetical protein